MEAKQSKEEEMKRQVRKSAGREDSLTSVERIPNHTYKQWGYSRLSLARLSLKEPPEELWDVPKLEKLNLSLNCLRALPPTLSILSNLVVLNLWGIQNQLTSLPPEIGQLRHLRVLFCYSNQLTEVPEELGNCTRLEVLSLTNNKISGLPASFASLICLRKLNLSHNKIVHIPGCIYTMKSLVFLHLACNRLECIADSIAALVELKILIVEGNEIHSLPKIICCLTRLELLNVDFNDIQNVPQEMHQLSRLEKLACHPLDKELHIMQNPLQEQIKEVLEGDLTTLFNYLKSN
ncbi:leucine-rich repeat-containing protein 30-like [Oncorhynchus kisutch]|uniref:leucine-rich repeat-containing protein 30-like n=1 Tax=Oncorhynchus kisutch TaxID=8019 RepID=UPI0012DD57FF|nr:leucine-rich repeat-containing protein 30-like [Oncorhynchus kisutch]